MAMLISCGENNNTLPQDFDRTNQNIILTVTWHDNQEEVDLEFVKSFGEPNPGRTGFAVWKNPGNIPYTCDIHGIRPKSLNDENMDTLGHELTHCLIGTFHP